MDISYLTDTVLIADTRNLVRKEKELTLKILIHLKEIETRKLYSLYNQPSLFEFCVHELKFSEQESFLRITAMRLIKSSPTIEKKIEQGKINITQASEIQRHLQRQPQENRSEEKTLELIDTCEGKSVKETKVILQILEGKKAPAKNLKISPELAEKMNLVKKELGLYGDEEVLNVLCDKFLKERAAKREKEASTQPSTIRKPQDPKARILTAALKRKIHSRAGSRCEILSAITGERCPETSRLEYHHIVPFSVGGQTTEENLLLICSNHHARVGIEFFGHHKMNSFSS